jgi:hypothetical protein
MDHYHRSPRIQTSPQSGRIPRNAKKVFPFVICLLCEPDSFLSYHHILFLYWRTILSSCIDSMATLLLSHIQIFSEENGEKINHIQIIYEKTPPHPYPHFSAF